MDEDDRRRRIGRVVAHQAEGRRALGLLAAQREDITEDITEEVSAVIREELARRKSDAPALSAQAFGVHLSARGRVVWLVAVLLALLAGAVLLGRVTAPHKAPATEAPR